MNGVKVNRSANRANLKRVCRSESCFHLICSENSVNIGNISNIRKKNPTLTLSKSGWERGAVDGTRTRTVSLPGDFKSPVSTDSTTTAANWYDSTFLNYRQVHQS